MKKFVFIPYDEYEILKKNSKTSTATHSGENQEDETLFTNVQKQENIIDPKLDRIMDADIPIDKKRMLYTQLLEKHLDQTGAEGVDRTTSGTLYDAQSLLKAALPKSSIKHAIGIYDFISNDSSIQWNQQGEVIINGNLAEKKQSR